MLSHDYMYHLKNPHRIIRHPMRDTVDSIDSGRPPYLPGICGSLKRLGARGDSVVEGVEEDADLRRFVCIQH